MHEMSLHGQTELIDSLRRQTVTWFEKNKNVPTEQLFCKYFYESRVGMFKNPYSMLLDGSTECLVEVLPVLVSKLVPGVANAISVSRIKTRLILNMMIYWLTQFHSGNGKDIPEPYEARDVFSGILESNAMRVF